MEADNHRLDALIATQQEISAMGLNLDAILNLVVKRAQELSHAEGVVVQIIENDELILQAAAGLVVPQLNTPIKLEDKSLSGQSYLKGQLLYCEDTETDDRVARSLWQQTGIRSILVAPIPLASGEVGGVLQVISRKVTAFSKSDIQSVQFLAGLTGLVIRQVREALISRELEKELARHTLREAELQLSLSREKELYRNTNQFISLISHDFRTPLTAIQSSTELLQYYADRFTPEKKAEIYERVHSSVRYLTELLDNIALIGKHSVGKLQFQPEPISPEDLCKSLVSEIEPAGTSQPRLVYTGPTENNYLLLDKNLTRLILWHLLNNALKYSPQDAPVELNLAIESEAVVFTVKDRGIGIPAQDQAKIFDIFFRGSNVPNVRGSGIGLTIVRNCLVLHGGSIKLTSEAGQGTAFTVRLPTTPS